MKEQKAALIMNVSWSPKKKKKKKKSKAGNKNWQKQTGAIQKIREKQNQTKQANKPVQSSGSAGREKHKEETKQMYWKCNKGQVELVE